MNHQRVRRGLRHALGRRRRTRRRGRLAWTAIDTAADPALRHGSSAAFVITEHACSSHPGPRGRVHASNGIGQADHRRQPRLRRRCASQRVIERPSCFLLLVEWERSRTTPRDSAVGRLPGLAGGAAPLLRPVPRRRALRDGRHRVSPPVGLSGRRAPPLRSPEPVRRNDGVEDPKRHDRVGNAELGQVGLERLLCVRAWTGLGIGERRGRGRDL